MNTFGAFSRRARPFTLALSLALPGCDDQKPNQNSDIVDVGGGRLDAEIDTSSIDLPSDMATSLDGGVADAVRDAFTLDAADALSPEEIPVEFDPNACGRVLSAPWRNVISGSQENLYDEGDIGRGFEGLDIRGLAMVDLQELMALVDGNERFPVCFTQQTRDGSLDAVRMCRTVLADIEESDDGKYVSFTCIFTEALPFEPSLGPERTGFDDAQRESTLVTLSGHFDHRGQPLNDSAYVNYETVFTIGNSPVLRGIDFHDHDMVDMVRDGANHYDNTPVTIGFSVSM